MRQNRFTPRRDSAIRIRRHKFAFQLRHPSRRPYGQHPMDIDANTLIRYGEKQIGAW